MHESLYQEQLKELDERRGTAHERGYTKRWYKARTTFLRSHPLCAQCLREGRTTAARVVDHIIPHQGNQQLFWDKGNWQPLCDHTSPWNCHGKKTAAEANARKRGRQS